MSGIKAKIVKFNSDEIGKDFTGIPYYDNGVLVGRVILMSPIVKHMGYGWEEIELEEE